MLILCAPDSPTRQLPRQLNIFAISRDLSYSLVLTRGVDEPIASSLLTLNLLG